MSDYERKIGHRYANPCPRIEDVPEELPIAIKHDEEKPLLALVPALALEEEARVWTFGAKKYSAWNWTNGFKYVRIISAILRHIYAILRGEDRDPETGLLHAAHARCGLAMLIEYQLTNRTDLDDRQPRGTNGEDKNKG